MKYQQEILKNIFIEFRRNKARVFLTSLGITIGVFAVVMLIAIGLGFRNYLSQQFKNLGSNIMVVLPGQNFSSIAASTNFDERDVRALSRIEHADFIVPAFITNVTMETAGNESKAGAVIATTYEYPELINLEIIAGKSFSRADQNSSSKVAIIAENLANELFDSPEDAIGETIRFRGTNVEIVGAVKNVGNPERDNAITMPYTASYTSINPDKNFFIIYVGVDDEDQIIPVKSEVEEIMLERYDDNEFGIFEPSDVLSTLDQVFNIVNWVLVALGSISLIVGGVGIMNIMYANVTERTKEIGIRRAVGAKKSDILVQFIIESAILALIGGIAGLLLSVIIVLIARNFFPLEINALAVVVAIGVSSAIGVFFGVFPARRAANLTPIEAIRG